MSEKNKEKKLSGGNHTVQKRGNDNKKKEGTACKVAKKCGGCQYQGVPYEKQLSEKQKAVRQLMQPFCKTAEITGMQDPYHYRNKVHAVFARKKDGTIISGVYEEGTHRVVPVEACQIEDEKADAIINDIRGLLKSFKIKTYNEDTGYGLLRHVLIRRGFTTGEIMVVLVLGSPVMPSKNNFVKALRKLHPEITTVVLNVNDKRTSMVLGDRETTIYGKGYIEDTLCGCTFRISPKSFYQINHQQCELLYSKALDLLNLTGQERIIDAYCGIGTIGMIVANRTKEVTGVELNKDAVKDAINNAKMNKIENIKFINDDASAFMIKLAKQKQKVDCVIMDPPRSGSTQEFMDAVKILNPKQVVYISCDPSTQVRDIKYFAKIGYRGEVMYPVDMFPHTSHVETIVLLSKI